MSKRAQTRRRQKSEPLDVSVCDGTRLVGRIVWIGAGWRAEGADGKTLGVFEARSEARAALSKQGEQA